MLGEAALTAADAQAYMVSYQQAIHAIGKASNGRGIYEGPGISIKLSALHPRYSRAQYDRVMEELYPRLKSLTLLARQYDIGINIDAEEADRPRSPSICWKTVFRARAGRLERHRFCYSGLPEALSVCY